MSSEGHETIFNFIVGSFIQVEVIHNSFNTVSSSFPPIHPRPPSLSTLLSFAVLHASLSSYAFDTRTEQDQNCSQLLVTLGK